MDPGQVLALLIQGAFGSRIGVSYTLYYATTFVFTGLAVAVAFHGGLFNIGGEGQAMLGGSAPRWWRWGSADTLPALARAAADGARRGGCSAWPGPRCRRRCRPGAAATW